MTSPSSPPTPDPTLLKLIGRALGIAEHGDLERAARVVERIGTEFPDEGVVVACLAWCDALVSAVPDLGDPDKLLNLEFMELGSGHVSGADDVPPDVRWAGRFLAARARMDTAQGQALIDSVPDDEQWGRNVLALLQMVAFGRTRPELGTLTPGWGSRS